MSTDLRRKLFIIFIGSILFFFNSSYGAIWDWEDGTLQGWKAKDDFSAAGDTLQLSNSTERAYHGAHSIKWHIQGTTSDSYWYVTVDNPKVNPGETVFYHVWVPGGTEVRGLKTFLKDNNGNWVDGNWYDQWHGMVRNAWNELTITIPQTGAFPMLEVGLQVAAATSTVDVTVYLDYVVCGVPNPPTGLTAVSLSLSEIALDWNDNTEANFAYYKIYRDTSANFPLNSTTFVDTTSMSEFIDTGLSAFTQYYYKITAVDADGDESLPSEQVSATTSEPGAPPLVGIKHVNSTTIGLYEKFEAILVLNNADYDNPYNPDEIDVQATFISPSGKQWKIFGFFDDYNGVAQWKVRFAPNEIGQWSYSIQATDKDGTGNSETIQFTATASEHHGWIHVSEKNPHYLEYDDGTPFYGVGMYVAWGLTIDQLDLLQEYDANIYAMWNISYGGYISSYGLIENDLGKYNQPKCGRIDEMIEMSEDRGLKVMFCFWPHDLFSNTVWAHIWDQNPYRLICDVKDVYSDSLCWEYQKKQYRYLIARWGYSHSLAIWEIINEINGTDGWAAGRRTEALNWVKKVHDYFQENDPYNHPTTASKSGGYTEYEPGLYAYCDIPNLHIYEYQGWPIKSQSNLPWSSLHNFAFAAKRFWDSFPKPAIIGEADVFYQLQNMPHAPVAYHNAIWAAMTNGLAMIPVWWKLDEIDVSLLDRMSYFSKFVSKIDFINESKKHFEALTEKYDLFGMNWDSTAFGWIRDRYGRQITGQSFSFPNVLSDEFDAYKIDYYNPWNGEWFDSRIALVVNGQVIDRISKLDSSVPDVAFYIQSAQGGVTPTKLQLTTFTERLHNSEQNRAEILCYIIDENGLLCNNSDNLISFKLKGPGQLSHSEITATNGVAKIEYQASVEIGTARIIASSPGILPDTVAIEITYPSAVDNFDKASSAKIPSAYSLSQNYPNPFNATTTIQYDVPEFSHVTIAILNANGQLIEILVDSQRNAGRYTISWDGSNVASGLYFIRMQADNFEMTRKCLLLK